MPMPSSVDSIVDGSLGHATQALWSQRAVVGPVWLNVKSDLYGAVGDGVTNDTVAIQAALTAAGTAGGGIVYCPPGTYMIGPNFQTGGSTQVCLGIPDNTMLLGAGAGVTVFKLVANAANASSLWLLMGSKNFNAGGARININCVVRDLTFDGNSANQSTTGTHHGIVFWPVTNHYIENVTVQNLAAVAGSEHFGFWIDGETTGADTGAPGIVNGVVHACRAINTGTGFAAHTLVGELFSDCIATNCTVFQGFTVWSGSTTLRTREVSIIGCRADGCTNGFEVESAAGTRIVGCTARNNLNAGIQVTGSGVSSTQASDRTIVIGNQCYDNGQNNSGFFAQSGIALTKATNSPTNALITGNQCYDDQVTPTQLYGVAVDATIAAGSQNSVINNNCRGNKTANTLGVGPLFQNLTESGSLNLAVAAAVPTGMTSTFTVDADSIVIVHIQGVVDWTVGTGTGLAGDVVQADLRVDSTVKVSNAMKCTVNNAGADVMSLSWAQTLAAGSHTIDMQIANQTGARGNFGRGNIAVQVIPFQQ